MAQSEKKIKNQGFNGLKLLCILSVFGFVYCMAYDSSKYLTYSNYDSSVSIKDARAYELIEDELKKWENNGIPVDKIGISKIALLFLIRSIIDVLALLGVALMYYRIKLGYTIYSIFQISYVALPFVLLGENAGVVITIGSMAINLIYVALFTTQKKYLRS